MSEYLFERRPISDHFLFKMRPRKPSIDELARGKFVNAQAVMRKNLERRNEFSYTTKGYTKNRNQRMVADIPYEFLFNPEYKKYFEQGMDKHERRKNLWAFLKKFPQYKTVDKL